MIEERLTTKEIKENIKQKFDEISKLLFKGTCYTLEIKGKELLNLIFELRDSTENTEIRNQYITIIHDLSHTLNKEVQYAKDAYKASLKKNAPQKRKSEFENEMRNAVEQIHSDISLIISNEA